MPTDVIMPQMGESIFEGTLTKWLKKPGDKIQRDEPLFEISTDKVDAEIPAPVAGVLLEQKVKEGTTVQVNAVVGVIGEEGSSTAAAAPAAKQEAKPETKQEAKLEAKTPPQEDPAKSAQQSGGAQKGAGDKDTRNEPTPTPKAEAPQPHAAAPAQLQSSAPANVGSATAGPQRSSPLVRRIAKDNSVDLAQLAGQGTGAGGRITKDDILGFIQQHGAGGASAPAQTATSGPGPAQSAASAQGSGASQVGTGHAASMSAPTPGELVPMSKMRGIIAKRMVESKHTSAHVHTVFKVDMTRIVKIREKQKNSFEQRNGVKLTYMPFIARAVMAGIKAMPIVNSSVEGESIRYHKNVNLGIAVALDWGLIVPVVKQAEERSFLGLARGIVDVAERARAKRLQPDEVQGGTFTITNPGIFGPQFGTPIINQPQVAILGMGGLFKEPVVITDKDGNDSIAIRSIIRLTLGYDHRIIDGADADRFMVSLRNYLENWAEDIG